MMKPFSTAAALLLATTIVSTAQAQSCSGCGCKGGPGYRGPDGHCVGWTNIGRVCGSPPTKRCTPELVDRNASAAADHGVKAIELAPRSSIP